MIAVDTNLLVFAHRADSTFHKRADQVIRELAEGGQLWALPWPCLHEFLAIVTHPRIYRPPTPLEEALTQVDSWLESPHLQLIGETPSYWEVLRKTLARGKVSGPAVHDARIAAICLAHGIKTLWSADRDFSRVEGLHVVNPLL